MSKIKFLLKLIIKFCCFSESVPLSRDLALAVRAEKKLFDGMSVNNRKKFKDLQTWV